MFENKHKQKLLEKAREFFLDWIETEADPELEAVEQKAIYLQTISSKLERIRSDGKLKEFMAQYEGNLLEDLNHLKKEALEIMNQTIIVMAKMVFSVFSIFIAALLIFLIPTTFFSITSLSFLPEAWRSDLEESINRLEKTDQSRLFIGFKRVQFLLELFWAGISIAWDNLWLSKNENAG